MKSSKYNSEEGNPLQSSSEGSTWLDQQQTKRYKGVNVNWMYLPFHCMPKSWMTWYHQQCHQLSSTNLRVVTINTHKHDGIGIDQMASDMSPYSKNSSSELTATNALVEQIGMRTLVSKSYKVMTELEEGFKSENYINPSSFSTNQQGWKLQHPS